MLRLLRPACLSLALLFPAMGASAAPVMTFTAVHATTGIDHASEWISSGSSFWETGSRFNLVYTLRDEVVVDNGLQTISHYRDVTYDVEGHWRDAAQVSLDVNTIGEHTAQFWVVGTLVAAQVPRLVAGPLDFQASLSLGGEYSAGTVPELPDLPQPPAPPVFADMSSGTPAALPAWANYDPSGSFDGGSSHAFTAARGQAHYEYSYLLYGNGDLLTRYIDFTLHGPGYDRQVRNLGYTELLGIDVIAIPEPRTWAMLLAGAGVLVLSRRSRSVVFRN